MLVIFSPILGGDTVLNKFDWMEEQCGICECERVELVVNDTVE